jgi:hypothetical protein
MIKPLLMGLALLACAASAEAAEVWNCTYVHGISEAVLVRFEVSPPDLIDTGTQERYRILQNNEHSLIATISISRNQEGQRESAIGALSLEINKATGEFWWKNTFAGVARAHGKCRKD